jgi:hypothetical protein
MRLLEIKAGGESLTEFIGNNIPPYAILSHTWGSVDEEVNFRDLVDHTGKDKVGYAKIQFCGRRATTNDLWVDTCCIGKSSRAELTEAINYVSLVSEGRQMLRIPIRCFSTRL